MATKEIYSTFCQPNARVNISVYERDGATQDRLTTRVFTETSLFKEHINKTPSPQLRIVSIHSVTSLDPLQISKDGLEALKDKYNIGPELWDLTLTFGNKPLIAAAGEGVMRIQEGDNGIRDLSYRFTFPVTGGPGRWTMRQVGVFHHHDPKSLRNLWIFFHVKPVTPVQKELEAFASTSHKGPCTDTTWFTLHHAVLTSCLNEWRSYINYLGHDVDRHFDRTQTFIYKELNHEKMAEDDGNLAGIYHARNRLLETPYRLMATLETLQKLGDLSRTLSSYQKVKDNGFEKLATSAAYYKEHLEPLVKGIEFTKEKVEDMLKMIEIGLSFRMNSKMLDLNNQLLQLGNKNFDDNATVKIVTLVTLIYLPASLVSSVLGMNLFKFDDGSTEGFTVSKQFWIFIVATIILAIITLGGWYIWTHKEEVMRRKSRFSKGDMFKGAEKDIELHGS